ncbi:MAG: NAD(P)/FAD-dependent oxidoreductase [Hyphomicrobiaceae bacterium]
MPDGTEIFDVIVVGAGVSGLGTACHLKSDMPHKRILILEREETFGGTWLTNTYPGARSDSDLFTYGYRFKPWMGAHYASREEILAYLGEVVAEHALDRLIRYGMTVTAADWSSADALWTLTVAGSGGESLRLRTRFLAMCQGYYHHRKGYWPDWPGLSSYTGEIVHSQEWPEDLDVSGRSIVVIGSGATAATLVPALARSSGPITLLQRSPSWYFWGSSTKDLVELLRRLDIDPAWIHEIARRKSVADEAEFIRRTLEEPEAVKAEMLEAIRDVLGPGFDIETHFHPRYRPWQQRVCYIPDADFLETFRSGKATIVTAEIERFTPDAIRLRSGRELKADLVVAATGFDLCLLGDVHFSRDGEPVDIAETVTYRGMMFSGLPNLTWTFGYLRASWTLRVDMNAEFLCRLLRHMDANGHRAAMPQLLPEEQALPRRPWVEPENFNGGYLMRSLARMPRSLDRPEWRHMHDYWAEKDTIPAIDLADGRLRFA